MPKQRNTQIKEDDRNVVMEYVYKFYFAMHIPLTLIMAPQLAFPFEYRQYIPEFAQKMLELAVSQHADPLLWFALQKDRPFWVTVIFQMELFLQLPFFFYALYCLFRQKNFKIPAIIFSAHILTVGIFVLSFLIQQDVSFANLTNWLKMYLPFYVVPFSLLLNQILEN